jgi:uncharacterized repeat protein (TIGR01451 family)
VAACSGYYKPSENKIYLKNDAGTNFDVGSVYPSTYFVFGSLAGGSGAVENSQCRIEGFLSGFYQPTVPSYIPSIFNLQVGVNPFKPAFGGYRYARTYTTSSGWNMMGDVGFVPGLPDIRVTSGHTGNFTRGQQGTYTINVQNVGTLASSGQITVTDSLPAGMTFVSASPANGWTCSTTAPSSPTQPSCTRSESLALNGSYPPLSMVVSVPANATTGGINQVSVLGGGDTSSYSSTDPTGINATTSQTGIITFDSFGVGEKAGQAAFTTKLGYFNVGAQATTTPVAAPPTLPCGGPCGTEGVADWASSGRAYLLFNAEVQFTFPSNQAKIQSINVSNTESTTRVRWLGQDLTTVVAEQQNITGAANGLTLLAPSNAYGVRVADVGWDGVIIDNVSYSVGPAPPPSSSVNFSGSYGLKQTTASVTGFTGLVSFRVETRIHDISTAYDGFNDRYIWGLANWAFVSLTKRTDISGNTTINYDNTCTVNIGNRTDVTIRAERYVNLLGSLEAWDSNGVLVSAVPCSGKGNNFDLSGVHAIGTSPFDGGGVTDPSRFSGKIAYFRFYSGTVGAGFSAPTEAIGAGNLLNYTFEGNPNNSSVSTQPSLAPTPATATIAYSSTPVTPPTPSNSISLTGAYGLRQTIAGGGAAFVGTAVSRIETRIHDFVATSTVYPRYIWHEDGKAALSVISAGGGTTLTYGFNCSVGLGTRTDVIVRGQRQADGTGTLQVWQPDGVLVGAVTCSSLQILPDLSGVHYIGTLSYDTQGATYQYRFVGKIAYFRLFSTILPVALPPLTPAAPPPTETSGTGNLFDYRFETNLNDTSGTSQPTLVPVPSLAPLTYAFSN